MTTLFMMTFFFLLFSFSLHSTHKDFEKKVERWCFCSFSSSCFVLRTYLSVMTAFWITSFGFSVLCSDEFLGFIFFFFLIFYTGQNAGKQSNLFMTRYLSIGNFCSCCGETLLFTFYFLFLPLLGSQITKLLLLQLRACT